MERSRPDENESPENRLDRREFLEASAAAAAGAFGAAPPAQAARIDGPPLLPEEYWRERMKAPDDGKKYAWLVDVRRCFGCHACEVACKAENDVPLGQYIRQTIYHDRQDASGRVARLMVPMACQHCEDAPCIKACPCGALHKGAGGTVQIDYDLCSGHASCRDACPYGAIYIDTVANQAVKCHNCTHRVDVGLEPACVATCPSEALYFGDLNDPASKISKLRAVLERENGTELEVFRPEKGTKPRMEFVVDERHRAKNWDAKIPGEGESYSSGAYDVYNWAEPGKPEGEAK